MNAPAKPAGAAAKAPQSTGRHDTGHVDVLAGITNILGTVVSGIESAISVAAAPSVPGVQPGVPATIGTGAAAGGGLGAVFASIQDAQTAVAEVNEVIADAKAGRWSEEPADVVALLKASFAILGRFGVNVPVVSAIVAALPAMAPVVTPSAA